MNDDNNKKLISTGNKIITNYSSLKSNNISNIINNNITTREETLSKSNNDDNIKTIKHSDEPNSNININTHRNLFLHSTINPNDTKKSTYSNISKLIYKDGLILRDAANSNPGYGLWAVKLNEQKKPLNLKNENKEENNIINSYNSNIYSDKLFNNINNIKLKENSLFDSDSENIEIFDTNSYEDDIDKIIINKLNKRTNKLEKRYSQILNKYYSQENYYLNLEKLLKEYEQLVKESIKEKNDIQKECTKLDNNNQALINSISNARKEIERLIMVIKEEQIKMKKELEEYNEKLIEEELKRKKIIDKIKFTEKQITILQDKIEEENNSNNNLNINKSDTNNNTGATNTCKDFNKTKKGDINNNNLIIDDYTKNFYKIKKETKKEKDLKINRKLEYIKQLQEELERLKIEDEEKLKEKRDLYELINEKNINKKYYKINMDKMYNELEIQERKNKWNNNAIKIRNNIITNLKRYSNSK
jgi:hypothetical protein